MNIGFSNPAVVRRFVILMAIATFVMFTIWAVVKMVQETVPGDFEVRQGDIHLQDGAYNDAIERFDEALRVQPNHRGALMGKSVALIELKRYREAEMVLTHAITYLKANMEPDDKTGIGALSAAYSNRGIIKDRQGRYKEAFDDYIEAIRIDYDLAEGPGVLNRLLYHDRTPSSVLKRAEYLYKQFLLPENERVMRVPEIDAEQRTYKP